MLRGKDGKISQIFSDLASLSTLYKLAYGQGALATQFSDSRVIMNFKDSLKYKVNSKTDYRTWGEAYMFQIINNSGILRMHKRQSKSWRAKGCASKAFQLIAARTVFPVMPPMTF